MCVSMEMNVCVWADGFRRGEICQCCVKLCVNNFEAVNTIVLFI